MTNSWYSESHVRRMTSQSSPSRRAVGRERRPPSRSRARKARTVRSLSRDSGDLRTSSVPCGSDARRRWLNHLDVRSMPVAAPGGVKTRGSRSVANGKGRQAAQTRGRFAAVVAEGRRTRIARHDPAAIGRRRLRPSPSLPLALHHDFDIAEQANRARGGLDFQIDARPAARRAPGGPHGQPAPVLAERTSPGREHDTARHSPVSPD